MIKVEYTKEQAKELGFKELEKLAKKELKKMFKGDWKGAEIIEDVEDNRIVYKMGVVC